MLRDTFNCPNCKVEFRKALKSSYIYCPYCGVSFSEPGEGVTLFIHMEKGVYWGMEKVRNVFISAPGDDKPLFKIDLKGGPAEPVSKFDGFIDDLQKALGAGVKEDE